MTLSNSLSALSTMSNPTSSNTMQNAISAVNEDEMHVRASARLYNASHETLRRQVGIYTDGVGQSGVSKRGQKQYQATEKSKSSSTFCSILSTMAHSCYERASRTWLRILFLVFRMSENNKCNSVQVAQVSDSLNNLPSDIPS